MNDAIYYADGTKKPSAQQVLPDAVTPAPIDAGLQTAPTQNKKPKGLTSAGPFMQPDVFSMPDKNALKETATSTHTNKSTPGLTVPQR